MVQVTGVPASVTTRRLCVAFLDCPTVAKGAANYLVLAQNRVQQVFEFAAFDLDRMREQLREELKNPPEPPLALSNAERAVVDATSEHDLDNAGDIKAFAQRAYSAVELAKRYVKRESALYPHQDGSLPDHWVVFTEARFTREFYLANIGNVALVSLGYWRASMAPP